MEGFLVGLMGPEAGVSVALETEESGDQIMSLHIRTARNILGGVAVNLDLPI